MVVLHGIWSPPSFHLWAERPSGAGGNDAEVANGAPISASRDPAAHPAAWSCRELHAELGDISEDGLLASVAGESSLKLWLPCCDGLPIPSTQAESADGSPIDLRVVTVPTLSFSPADAVDLLTGFDVSALTRCGQTLRYWRMLTRYALTLLIRQQFVPDLEEADGSLRGRWRVFITDRQEIDRLEQFVRRMPAVCRAVASVDPSAHHATRLADSFIMAVTEAVILRSVSGDPFFRQIHDRAEREEGWELSWLSSLLGGPDSVRWFDEECAAIPRQIRSWIGRLEQDSFHKPPELVFALIEPEDESGSETSEVRSDWRVRLDLRVPDSGEGVKIEEVWQDDIESPSLLGQHLVNRRDHLRSELARAAEVFPLLAKAMEERAPTSVNLSTDAAHAFLQEWAPLLRAQGFEVRLPDWATSGRHRLGLELFVQPIDGTESSEFLSLGNIGLGTMLDFDWRIAIGDDHLSIEEFEALAAQNAPLVRTKGGWVNIERTAAAKALNYLRNRPSGRLTLAEAIRVAAGAEETEAGLPILGLDGASWLNRFLSDPREDEIAGLKQPEQFNGKLRPYQLRGLEWLAFLDRLGIGACLADDMGLGKTIQLIALLLHERREARHIGPTLLFVPMSVVGNWYRETRRFAPNLKAMVHHGPDRLAGEALKQAAHRHDLLITTYGLAQRDLKSLQRIAWHRIVLDEAQKIKNPSASQTIAIRSLRVAHRVALTGTPLENHLSELWSIMEMLNPGLLGSAAAFRKQFAVPIEKMGNQGRAEQLRRMIRPFVLRRMKSDPKVECDLPEKMEMRVYCNLTAEQAALYRQTVQQMLGEIDRADGIRRRGLVLATLTKLKQICNHPAHILQDGSPLIGRSGKCERLVEMLEEVIEEGDAAIIFTQYKVMGDLLVRLLTERLRTPLAFLHGETPAKQRDKMVQAFQASDGNLRIFILSLRAGGFGLNLTKANHVFHFDRWWNPAVEEQATDRAHRIGQTRRVQVHKYVCIGTIEDRIDKLLAEKSALADRIIGSGDEWLTGLSTEELRDYLTLSSETIAEF